MSGQPPTSPSWNNSTTVMAIICDRLREQNWGTFATPELLVHGPVSELDQRPPNLGQGLWR